MQKDESVDYCSIRKEVSKLILYVISKKISVREALIQFPKNCEDATIVAAWHALCHLEADEDIRKKDIVYSNEQDEYIEYIAHVLEAGEELPANIINSYKLYHDNALGISDNSLKGIVHQLKKFLN